MVIDCRGFMLVPSDEFGWSGNALHTCLCGKELEGNRAGFSYSIILRRLGLARRLTVGFNPFPSTRRARSVRTRCTGYASVNPIPSETRELMVYGMFPGESRANVLNTVLVVVRFSHSTIRPVQCAAVDGKHTYILGT